MEQNNVNNEHTRKISRKRFFQLCGSLIAGGSILGTTGVLLHKMYRASGTSFVGSGSGRGRNNGAAASPYKLVSSFKVPDPIEGFEHYNDQLIVAASNNLYLYDQAGTLLNNFAIGSQLRDMAVDNGLIYLLFPARIEVYTLEGEWLRDWEACSDLSDYCSMAITSGFVFVTDAANKNICKYTTEGAYVTMIESPNGFIIPSYSFGIVAVNGMIFCSNSGRHQVESYTLEGTYAGAFGKAGGAAGMFCGCCNPVHLSNTSTGEIITSEKGNPRISCYSQNGQFRNILLDDKALGGGNTAYDVKVQSDEVYIAGKNQVSVFRYDPAAAAQTACADCRVNCPLRKGVTI